MKLKEFNILLDIKKHNKSEEFEVVQGDYDTNVLNISIVEGLKPYNLDDVNVEIAFAKPDGTTVLQDIDNGVTILDPIGGKVQCVLKTNTIAAAGRVFAEVRILQGNRLLTTARFSFFVRKAIVNDETIISTNEFPILNQKIEEVNDLIEYVQGMEPIKGDDGKSAYEVWLDAGNEGTVEDFLESLKGETGPEGKQGVGLDYTWRGTQLGIKREDEAEYSFTDLRGPKGEKGDKGDPGEKGEKGDPGTGINVKGSLNDPSELPSTGDLGDAYLINGNLWVWDGETFVNAGNIKGPKGDPGSDAEVTKENIEAALGYTPVKSVNNVVADEIGNVELDIDTSEIENRIGNVEDDLAAHKADNVHKQRTATVIVATYNSKQSSKDGADYICSETNAQQVINQAIQSIADTGGKVVLMEGIYNISSPIYINVSNVTLEGMGQSTVIDANETPISCIGCENVENVTIKSITFKNTGGTYNCIHFINVTNCVVADCKLVNNGGNGINMIQAIDSIVRNCISDSNGLSGIRLEECINCKIANNICRKNFLCGILIINSSHCHIADNTLIDNTYQNSNPENNYGHIGMYAGGGLSNDNNYIVGNICRGQAYRGIAVRGSNNIVIHNDLRGSGTIELQDGGTNTITELAGNAISS